MKFSEPIALALEMATIWHAGQLRRDPNRQVPYIVHPYSVGLLLAQAGYAEEVIAAGLLHDVLEDTDVTQAYIARLFKRRIAALVAEVTEQTEIKDWKERKLAFLASLKQASPEALAIKCADHIDNLRGILRIARNGDDPWALFVGRAEKVWWEEAMYGLLKGRVKPKLFKLYVQSFKAFRKLAASTS
jgi:(p)ppGpp synthase/HD superfamily hydrolase